MRKVIDGKVFDTATAELIHEYWNGLGHSDFRCLEEGLYRTKKGQYFLAGWGGALTSYATSCGSGTSGGDGLFPISETAAREWLENHKASADKIEKHFKVEVA